MTLDTTTRATLWERLGRELVRFAFIFLYLWVLFGLFVLNERIILGQRGIGFASQGFAILNALVLGKIMLIAEDLKFGVRPRHGPLIVPILANAALFSALFLIVHVAEKVMAGLIHGNSAAMSVPAIGQGGLAGVLCVSAILFIALLPYFTFTQVGRVIGMDRLNAILLKTPEQSSP